MRTKPVATVERTPASRRDVKTSYSCSSEVHLSILLLALHCSTLIRYAFWIQRKNNQPSATPLRKCSWLSRVAPSRNAIIPASTQTAFNWAPLNSSVLRASSSKLTPGLTASCESESLGCVHAQFHWGEETRSCGPNDQSGGVRSRISIRFVAR